MSLLGKAKARPDQVAKVVQSVATNGLSATYRKVTSKLDSYTPLGYSLCGVVTRSAPASTTWRSATSWRARATSTRCTPS